SPGQINVQIPYEISPNTSPIVVVNNGGQVTSQTIPVVAAAPGIFGTSAGALVPQSSAARGQSITLYFTGGGSISPDLASGAGPSIATEVANLPRLVQAASVTVGGVQSPVDFVCNPIGLAGVIQ